MSRRPPTRPVTLRRLIGIECIDDVLEIVDTAAIEAGEESEIRVLQMAGRPAVWFRSQGHDEPAEWADHASRTLGFPVPARERRSGGLLVMDIDGCCYSVSYGQGFRWIADEFHDQRFGLSVAVRCLDPHQLRGLMRRRPGMRGRTESTLVPGGAPVWWVRPRSHAEIVRRITGVSLELPVTFAGHTDKPMSLEGSSGLRVRLAVDASSLVSDIRSVASVRALPLPDPELAFVDNIVPVQSPGVLNELNRRLESLLGGEERDDSDLALAVPDAGIDHLPNTHGFRIRIKVGRPAQPDIDISDLKHFASRYRPGTRRAALTAGTVEMCDSLGSTGYLWRARALNWLEATTTIEDARFFFMEGTWYEISNDYSRQVKEQVSNLFGLMPSMELPAWSDDWREEAYNRHVQALDTRFLCLDQKLVRDSLHTGPGLEVCDLLGPENELIHVKRAKGSSTLSHLFAQGLISASTISGSTAARRRFRDLVARIGQGRQLPDGFEPKKVVYAILLARGQDLTPQTLFPFAQATLAQAATELHQQGIHVEVIGIKPLS